MPFVVVEMLINDPEAVFGPFELIEDADSFAASDEAYAVLELSDPSEGEAG